ncbi:Uncharacterised protein [Mycobacteroides abscessus subsp. abscessus]|nr:Uncharacterised protein [Mycobacteroides abscessus subsp. abscessus]
MVFDRLLGDDLVAAAGDLLADRLEFGGAVDDEPGVVEGVLVRLGVDDLVVLVLCREERLLAG